MATTSDSTKPAKKNSGKDDKEGNAVFVRGLGESVTGEQLEAFFSGVGPIRRSFVVTNGREARCTGVGFVHFALHEDAKKALQVLEGATLGGRRVRLDFARRRQRGTDGSGGVTDADGGLRTRRARPPPPDATPAPARRGKFSGNVASCTVVVTRCNNNGPPLDETALLAKLGDDAKASGFESAVMGADGASARVLFRSWPHAGVGAARLHGNGLDACVDALRGGRKSRLIIRNLPFRVDRAELRRIFVQVAPVREITLPAPAASGDAKDSAAAKGKDGTKEKDGAAAGGDIVRCRGFGFVEYFLAGDANSAIAKINGTKIGGRVVAVDLAMGKSAFLLKAAAEVEAQEEPRKAVGDVKDAGDINKDNEEESSEDEEEKQKPKAPPKRAESTTEEMERTVFIRNLLYETSAADLWKAVEKRFGTVEQAVLVKDPMTGRPRGTAFVRFANVEQVAAAVVESDGKRAQRASKSNAISLQGRDLLIVRATIRERARDLVMDGANKKQKIDPRNMRLAWVGHIKPESTEARGMTDGDFAKREKAEKEKRMKLSNNPNAFISETRLSVRNLPRIVDEKFLKQMCLAVLRHKKGEAGPGPKSFPRITHAKVLRDSDRNDRSKGYGFVQFEEHRHALQALHKLNNNLKVLETVIAVKPKALDINDAKAAMLRREWGNGRRLIVEFSVEDQRQVAIINRLKDKGKAIKEAAVKDKEENNEEEPPKTKSRKRKSRSKISNRKKRKRQAEANAA